MEINERKEKINLLQMKSKRNTIIKEMKIKDIHLTLDSFLEPQHSYDLLGDLFNKIDKPVEYKEEFKFGHCKDKAAKELGLLYKKIPKQLQEKEVILFHLNYRETGAIILRLEDIFRDINWIVNFSGYSNGAFDFVVVEPTFIYGICIERFKYWDTFTIWGLFN
ncbi:hypothetical protein EYB33_16900 [Lysinibacillus sphaericus]|uniref:YxiF family protein n=1 Tax=Lysinibacillus sphaericus TaxID=1421 RepID=UPI001E4CE819|nr:hypothetical protein [Lysinibacillus sphaericus]UDK97884.1 hypothetical protein EYB33_16900 [Lysinibacillus sphaericus]